MTEDFKTFYFITILRTDISSSETKPAGLDFHSKYLKVELYNNDFRTINSRRKATLVPVSIDLI